MTDIQPILEVKQLKVAHVHGRYRQTLVDGVSFSIRQGETLGLVGESGSGKSLTANSIVGLLPNSLQICGGEILFQGENVLSWQEKKRRQLRGKEVSFVFQDYQGSFSPFMKVGKQLVETIRTHRKLSKKESKLLAQEWLDQVGLPAERVFNSYSFQLSGGQRQRAAIAAAMMLQPSLLVADEPTTALDVLSGELVLDLLTHMQKQHGCAVLLISHDLRHVMKRADTIAVMREGQIVEMEAAQTIRYEARHSYTQTLLKAQPHLTHILHEKLEEKRKKDQSVHPVHRVIGAHA